MMSRNHTMLFGFAVTVALSAAVLGVVALDVSRSAGEESSAPGAKAKVDDSGLRFFETEVKPILQANCYSCHGGKKKIKGGLRLTSRSGILKGGETGPVVSLDKPEDSLLLEAINYEDLEMPPKGRLPQPQIDILTRWVKLGAPAPPGDEHASNDESHVEQDIATRAKNWWSYRKLARPAEPDVKNKAWIANPIDAFVLARLEQKNLQPAPEADKGTLIRRVYYDLVGLPPTPAEVEAFVADTSPHAYEHLVDRLLDAPQYGERWARHWLDLVHYAESHGYERDSTKPFAWRYRDYVIDAFNRDTPYDQFVREQLAGDELDEVTSESLAATGYYRLGIWDDEPADREQAMFDMLDDIVSTTGQVFLGMTVGCARCHDHKKDPIPHEDYYRLLAFFRNVTYMNKENTRTFMDDQQGAVARRRMAEKETREARLYHELFELQEQFTQAARQQLELQLSDLPVSDLVELKYRFYRDTWDSLPDFDPLRPETEGDLAHNFITLEPASRDEAIGLAFQGRLRVPADGAYTFHLDTSDGVRLTIDGRMIAEYPGRGDHVHDVRVDLKQGLMPLRLDFFNNDGQPRLNFAWSGPNLDRKSLSAATPRRAQIEQLIRQHGPAAIGQAKTDRYFQLTKELAESKKADVVPREALQIMSVQESGRAPTHVLIRGSAHAPGPQVEPGFPQALGPTKVELPDKPTRQGTSGLRLTVADWMTSDENPLTPRVIANRLWQHHFGRGICRTPNDFGGLGELPSHPELLDWLAVELREGGWRLKRMHKLIMMSHTYRMSSADNEAALQVDPGNQLFWRFDMRRLTAEEIRDSILAVCGNLNLAAGGPSIYPVVSPEVMAGQSVPGSGWGNSSPEERARRSIYIFVKRSLIPPELSNFDFPDTDSSCAARFTTTVPTQSLNLLNSQFLNQQAAVFAGRLRREAGDDPAAQVKTALQLALSRQPKPEEVEWGIDVINRWRTEDGTDAEKALDYFCLLVLNLNEFMFVD